MIKELAYAKININLEVLDKRSDGFHNLKSLVVPIDLYDVLYFEESDKDEYVGPQIKNNNILKTVELFKSTYNIDKCVKVTLEKNIPISAGLAGGSSDSSAVLRGLNRLFNLDLMDFELVLLALKLGSDNAYCIYQRPMIMSGRGEMLNNYDLKFDKDILLIKPNFEVSTRIIFDNYKGEATKPMKIDDIDFYNDLLPVTLKLYPELRDLYNEIISLGYTPFMTGSGPTLFVVGDDLSDLKNKMDKNNNFVKLTKIKK